MYDIIIYKMMYQTKQNRTYKNKLKIATYKTDDLINKMLELKQIYKDFSYIIEFNKS